MNAVARIPSGGALVTEQHAAEIRASLKSSLYPGASDGSVDMVLAYCKAASLDPMTKPVHIVPMWDPKAKSMRDVIMPGIALYRTIAARSGCAGVSEPEFGPDVVANIGGVEITFPQWCRVTVRRRINTGEIVEFTAREFWMENYAVKGGAEKSIAPNAMWQKRPYGQLAKCAEAQALRKAFPEVGGQATAEEMEGKAIEVEATVVEKPVRAQLAPYPAADFDRNLSSWLAAIESGRKTADEIIAMVESKGTLTDEQKAAIRGTPAPAQQPEPTADDGEGGAA
jgi:phage recombination protein Bet